MLELTEQIEGTFASPAASRRRTVIQGLVFGTVFAVLFLFEESGPLAVKLAGAMLVVFGITSFWMLVFLPFSSLLTALKRRRLARYTFAVDGGNLVIRRSSGCGPSEALLDRPVSRLVSHDIRAQAPTGVDFGPRLRVRYFDDDRAERTFDLPLAYFAEPSIAALDSFLGETISKGR